MRFALEGPQIPHHPRSPAFLSQNLLQLLFKTMKHWIVKVHSDHGHQHSHFECDEIPHQGLHALVREVVAGPADTAEEAWQLWHKGVKPVLE